MKILASPRPSIGFEVLRESRLLRLVLPELDSCVAAPQNEYHRLDVYDHALAAVDAAPPEKPVVRLAALFHDLGKPATREVRGARVTFHGHETRGAEIAEAALTRLRFSNATKERVVHLVRHHMFHYHAGWSGAAVRRFVRRVGVENVADLFDLRIADVIGKGMEGSLVPLEDLRRKISAEMERGVPVTVRALAVTGTDVMGACGVRPGPAVGRILDRLLERVLADPSLNRRDSLLMLAREAADELGCRGKGGDPADGSAWIPGK
jgi:putative nucleotidyltransferase with HDIG domain